MSRILYERFHVVGGHAVGIPAAAEGRNLPGGFSIEGLDLGHPLNQGVLRGLTRAQVLLNEAGAEAALIELTSDPDGLDGFDFFETAARLNVLGYDFVDRLSGGHGCAEDGKEG